MTGPGLIFVIVAAAAVVATIGWFLFQRSNPERTAGHDEERAPTSARYFDPAGPGAEATGVAGPGEPVPGPQDDDERDNVR